MKNSNRIFSKYCNKLRILQPEKYFYLCQKPNKILLLIGEKTQVFFQTKPLSKFQLFAQRTKYYKLRIFLWYDQNTMINVERTLFAMWVWFLDMSVQYIEMCHENT